MSEPLDLPDHEVSMEIGVDSVAKLMALPPDRRPCLIDCREAAEIDICRIDGSEWLPLGQFPNSVELLRELSERGAVVYCHHGMRSMHAVALMRARGIERSFSMAGGIDLWSREIDPAVARY